VRAFFMIMIHERSDGRSKVRFAQQHHAFQTLGLGGLDKPLGE